MQKLYEVNLKMYVLADNEFDAEIIAGQADVSGVTVEVDEASGVDSDWYEALPFTDDEHNERTCGEIMEEQEAEEKYAKLQTSIPFTKEAAP